MATERRSSGDSRSGSRHRRKKPLHRRVRHQVRKKKWILPTIALLAAVVLVGVILIVSDRTRQRSLEINAGSSTDAGSGYRDIIWNGRHYRYNNRITAILLAGLDSDGELKEKTSYTRAPRADSIQLLILDRVSHEMKILALDRNTITQIRKYAQDGKDRGLMRDHLCLSYTYGDSGEASCSSLCEAVSILLYDVPVRDYVIVNRSSLTTLAQIIGPVELTVPNGDLAELDETFTAGNRVVIDGNNLEFFVRTRDIYMHGSNEGRMQRQKAYINAAMEQILEKFTHDSSSVWEDLEQIEDCMQTDITRSRYLELVRTLKDVSYSDADYLTPVGELYENYDYDEFHVDQEALLELVIDLFYLPV